MSWPPTLSLLPQQPCPKLDSILPWALSDSTLPPACGDISSLSHLGTFCYFLPFRRAGGQETFTDTCAGDPFLFFPMPWTFLISFFSLHNCRSSFFFLARSGKPSTLLLFQQYRRRFPATLHHPQLFPLLVTFSIRMMPKWSSWLFLTPPDEESFFSALPFQPFHVEIVRTSPPPQQQKHHPPLFSSCVTSLKLKQETPLTCQSYRQVLPVSSV